MMLESSTSWRKSSYSGSSGNGNCVEVAMSSKAVGVRDSKNTTGPTLTFSVDHRLIDGVRGAAFLGALAEGLPLSGAVDAGLADHADFDLAGNLAGLFSSGVGRGIVRT